MTTGKKHSVRTEDSIAYNGPAVITNMLKTLVPKKKHFKQGYM